jgi:hypothetical protein
MTESHGESPLHYTLHDLHNDTAAIMEAVNTQNRPAVITRMGRFITLIQPLANIENLEGKLIGAAIKAGDINLELEPGDRVYTTEEMFDALFGDNADRVRESVRQGEEEYARGDTKSLDELLADDSSSAILLASEDDPIAFINLGDDSAS